MAAELKVTTSVNTLELLGEFKRLGESMHSNGFDSFDPEVLLKKPGISNRIREDLIAGLANLAAEAYFSIQNATYSRGNREWSGKEKELLFTFVEEFQKLPGIKKEPGMKNFRNMKHVWESVAALISRDAGAVKGQYNNLTKLEYVLPDKQPAAKPVTNPAQSVIPAEKTLKEFNAAREESESTIASEEKNKGALYQQVVALADNLTDYSKEEISVFIGFLHRLSEDAKNSAKKDQKIQNLELKLKASQELLSSYDSKLSHLENSLQTIQDEVFSLRNQLTEHGIEPKKQSRRGSGTVYQVDTASGLLHGLK